MVKVSLRVNRVRLRVSLRHRVRIRDSVSANRVIELGRGRKIEPVIYICLYCMENNTERERACTAQLWPKS